MVTLFTRIIAHEIPAAFVFEDSLWVAFLDRFPVRPGHVLLVPRHEVRYLGGLPPPALSELGAYLAALTTTITRVCGVDDTTLILRDGPAAGQEIPHVHWHAIPRAAGDRPHDFAPATNTDDEATCLQQLSTMAAALRDAWPGI